MFEDDLLDDALDGAGSLDLGGALRPSDLILDVSPANPLPLHVPMPTDTWPYARVELGGEPCIINYATQEIVDESSFDWDDAREALSAPRSSWPYFRVFSESGDPCIINYVHSGIIAEDSGEWGAAQAALGKGSKHCRPFGAKTVENSGPEAEIHLNPEAASKPGDGADSEDDESERVIDFKSMGVIPIKVHGSLKIPEYSAKVAMKEVSRAARYFQRAFDLGDSESDEDKRAKLQSKAIAGMSAVISRYVAWIGYGEVRKREGGAGKVSDGAVLGYCVGFAGAAMCGLPIPSHGINGDGERYATGMSGKKEIRFHTADERLREPRTRLEHMHPAQLNKTGFSFGGVMRCNSSKCLNCTTEKAAVVAGEIRVGLEEQLYKGESYFFFTATLRHFFKDPRRMTHALRAVFRSFCKAKGFKKLMRKYGFSFAERTFEMTMDSLFENGNSGAHPHYHGVGFLHREIEWKEGEFTEYPIPDEARIRALERELSLLWFDEIKKYMDAVDAAAGREPRADKHRDSIVERGFQLELYEVPDNPRPYWTKAEREQWALAKEAFDGRCAAVVERWESGGYPVRDDVRPYYSVISRMWSGDMPHFAKQLAGVGAVSGYLSGAAGGDFAAEITGGALKKGHGEKRVSYFTWLAQAALLNDEKTNAKAAELLHTLTGLRVFNFSRSFRAAIRKDRVFAIYRDGKLVNPDPAVLTSREFQDDVDNFYQRFHRWLLPEVLKGDCYTLRAFGLHDDEFHAIHKHGWGEFGDDLNARLWEGRKVEPAVEDARAVLDGALAALPGMPAVDVAGWQAPVIPSYVLASDCWEGVDEAIPADSYKYQHILRLLKRFRPREFCDLALRCLASPALESCAWDSGMGVVQANFELFFGRCSGVVERIVLDAWNAVDGDGKRPMLERLKRSAEIQRRYLYHAMQDVKAEQLLAERANCFDVLWLNGFSEEFAHGWLEKRGYADLWRGAYGHFQIMRMSSDGQLRSDDVMLVDGLRCVEAAPLVAGLGFAGVGTNITHLEIMRGWWGQGFCFLDDRRRFERIKRGFESGFEPCSHWRSSIGGHAAHVVGEGRRGGRYAGYALVHIEGDLACEKARMDAERRDAARAEVRRLAERAGWRDRDFRRPEARRFLDALVYAVAALDADRAVVADALAHSDHASKGGLKEKDRCVSAYVVDSSRYGRWAWTRGNVNAILRPRWLADAYLKFGRLIEPEPEKPAEKRPAGVQRSLLA